MHSVERLRGSNPPASIPLLIILQFYLTHAKMPKAITSFLGRMSKAGVEHIWYANFRDSFESAAYKVRGIQNSVDAVMGQQPEGSSGNYLALWSPKTRILIDCGL